MVLLLILGDPQEHSVSPIRQEIGNDLDIERSICVVELTKGHGGCLDMEASLSRIAPKVEFFP